MRILPTPVNLNKSWKLISTFGISIYGCHHGLLPFKNPDAVTQYPHDHPVLFFQIIKNFGIQWFFAWIKILPEFQEVLRSYPIIYGIECFFVEIGWQEQRIKPRTNKNKGFMW